MAMDKLRLAVQLAGWVRGINKTPDKALAAMPPHVREKVVAIRDAAMRAEMGQMDRIEALKAIAQVLGISVDELLDTVALVVETLKSLDKADTGLGM